MDPQAQPNPTPIQIGPGKNPAPASAAQKGPFLTILAVILSIIAIALVALAIYMYSTGKTINQIIGREAATAEGGDEDDEDADADGEDEADDEEVLSTITGEFITAEVPENWTVTEYYDGDGTDTLTAGVVYTGLTGITIANPDGDVVFTLSAMYGIGGTEACEDFYQFADTSDTYYDEVVATNALDGSPAPTIIDLSAVDHTAFDFLNKSVRRVDTDLYWDKTPGAVNFDAACGIYFGAWELTDISFDADGDAKHTYHPEVAVGTPEDELLILDDILASFTPTP